MTTDVAARSRKALEPTNDEIRAWEISSNAKAAAELLAGRSGAALDIGCGEGKFTRSLTKLYGEVFGIDPKEKAIARAKAAAEAEGNPAQFQTGDARSLQFGDARFDTVAISNSLHHIPEPDKGLAEAARVLKPGGILYVMEPVASGHYHEATKVVNDETDVRREAFEAMLHLIENGFTETTEMMYRQKRVFEDFDDWREQQIDRDEKRRAKFDADPQGVRERFLSSADKEGGKLSFDQVFRVNVLRKDA